MQDPVLQFRFNKGLLESEMPLQTKMCRAYLSAGYLIGHSYETLNLSLKVSSHLCGSTPENTCTTARHLLIAGVDSLLITFTLKFVNALQGLHMPAPGI